MSITKIDEVKRLDKAVDYILRDDKTRQDLISTYMCDVFTWKEDFNEIYNERRNKFRRETKAKAKFLIQSFHPELDKVTPETAHEIGIEFAEKYLKGNHQYIIATHTDTEHIHNHIIFNQVRLDNYRMFDTKRRNTIENMKNINDEISEKYNLFIPDRQHTNYKYMDLREIKVRERGTSFKQQLEEKIDEIIYISKDYKDFIKLMEEEGFKSKNGKYLSFINEKTNKAMRTKTLGLNYIENSIKYRISNKEFQIFKDQRFIKNKSFDKSEDRFKYNYGLRKWASKQNLKYLQEISKLVFNEKLTLKDIDTIKIEEDQFINNVTKKIENIDNILFTFENGKQSFETFKNSYQLIKDYKSSLNKSEFKKQNYKAFKEYDKAKKTLAILKNEYSITNKEELHKQISAFETERSKIYKEFNSIMKDVRVASDELKKENINIRRIR